MAIMHDRIKELRNQKGLTLSQVATYLGVTEATAQRYETGKGIKTVPYLAIEKYANLFNCSPQYLMGWNQEEIDVASKNQEESFFDTQSIDIQYCDLSIEVKQMIHNQKMFKDEFGNIAFSDEEVKQIIAYARLLLSARK